MDAYAYFWAYCLQRRSCHRGMSFIILYVLWLDDAQ